MHCTYIYMYNLCVKYITRVHVRRHCECLLFSRHVLNWSGFRDRTDSSCGKHHFIIWAQFQPEVIALTVPRPHRYDRNSNWVRNAPWANGSTMLLGWPALCLVCQCEGLFGLYQRDLCVWGGGTDKGHAEPTLVHIQNTGSCLYAQIQGEAAVVAKDVIGKPRMGLKWATSSLV